MADENTPATEAFAKEMERLVADARNEITALTADPGAELNRTGTPGETAPINEALGRIEKALALQQPQLQEIGNIRVLLDRAREVEDAHQRLFDALHEELKGYKDSFLFDALQKPFIRDLISLHDDLQSAARQAANARDQGRDGQLDAEAITKSLDTAATNIDNLLHMLVEILNRLDVVREPASQGAVDKRTQKIVGTIAGERPEDDGQIVESLRPAFTWRGRPLRPEEVKIMRFG
jgi:molecular chaperone GrpE (heat shock protein)